MASTIRYALLNPLRRKARSLYAALGITVSVSAVVAIFSASRGIESGVVDLLVNFRGDILIMDEDAASIPMSRMSQEIVGQLRDDFAEVNGYGFRIQKIGFDGLRPEQVPALIAFARAGGMTIPDVEPRDLPSVSAPIAAFPHDAFIFDRLAAARQGLNADGEVGGMVRFSGPAAREAMVGRNVAEELRMQIDKFYEEYTLSPQIRDLIEEQFFVTTRGDVELSLPRLMIEGVAFEIIDVYETAGFSDNQLIIPLGAFQEVLDEAGRINAIVGLLPDGADGAELARDLERREFTLANRDVVRVQALDTEKILERFAPQLEPIRTMIFAVGLLAALGGAISVLNTMASSVYERTREIGVLRAVGWRQSYVIGAILLEGGIIALVGGILGVGLGYIELLIAAEVLNIPAITGGFDTGVVILGLSISIGLGVVGSFLPAHRAARLSPVDAVRQE
jgi:ABC-type antimicrobial peptide transport system permease subunit